LRHIYNLENQSKTRTRIRVESDCPLISNRNNANVSRAKLLILAPGRIKGNRGINLDQLIAFVSRWYSGRKY